MLELDYFPKIIQPYSASVTNILAFAEMLLAGR